MGRLGNLPRVLLGMSYLSSLMPVTATVCEETCGDREAVPASPSVSDVESPDGPTPGTEA